MLLPASSESAGAGLLIATNHWSVSIGSMIALVRSPRGTIMRCALTDSSRPSASRSATTMRRASKRPWPRYFGGAFSLTRASSVSTPMIGRP